MNDIITFTACRLIRGRYLRRTVTVTYTIDKGIQQVEADVYLWNQSLEKLLLDQVWSYDKFVSKGKMQDSTLYDP